MRKTAIVATLFLVALALGISAQWAAPQSDVETRRSIRDAAIGRTAVLTGRARIAVGVFLRCEPTRQVAVRLTLSAVANGRVTVLGGHERVTCAPQRQGFAVRTVARDGRAAPAGRARACALAVTTNDARQWCRNVVIAVLREDEVAED